MRQKSAFLAGVGALGTVVLGWQHLTHQGKVEVVNRAWVERAPKHPRDEVGWFLPTHLRGRAIGVMQRSSAFKFAGERFRFTRQGDRFTLVFPQSDRRIQLKARARTCRTDGFDYCLDVSRGERTITLYSRKGWTLPTQTAEVPWVPLDTVVGDCESCVDAPPSALRGLVP